MPLYKISNSSTTETVRARTMLLACAIFKAKYGKDKIIEAKIIPNEKQ
jgi:hypothetical protein